MKQFVFTLQALYDMKQNIAEQQKIRMRIILDKQARLAAELNSLKRSFDDTKERFDGKLQSGFKSDEFVQYGDYFAKLTASITVQKEQILLAEQEKQKCLEEQIETKKEIRTLEKLREKQYKEYLQELKMEEEKEIGDLVSFKVSSQ